MTVSFLQLLPPAFSMNSEFNMTKWLHLVDDVFVNRFALGGFPFFLLLDKFPRSGLEQGINISLRKPSNCHFQKRLFV
jgi:hypothetical protein